MLITKCLGVYICRIQHDSHNTQLKFHSPIKERSLIVGKGAFETVREANFPLKKRRGDFR